MRTDYWTSRIAEMVRARCPVRRNRASGPLQLTVSIFRAAFRRCLETAPFRPPDQVQRHSGDQTLVRRDVVF